MNFLVTGGAGFIGSHLVDSLLKDGHDVTVVDNFDPFYDPAIKRANISAHLDYDGYKLIETDIRDLEGLNSRLQGEYQVIVHLAAKAGVRPSILDPVTYQEVNVAGTQNMLELARTREIQKFVFASSSSVYGINPNVPWREDDHVLMPVSPYASTKVSGELLGHVYSHLYGIQFTALRFFTVYGPRQRPDLAIHKFARLMLDCQRIPIYGNGDTYRDYTFVDDVIQGIRAAINSPLSPYEVINIGNDQPSRLIDLIEAIADTLNQKPELDYLPEQPGDVPRTWASIERARTLLEYDPQVSLKVGLTHFADWFLSQHHNIETSSYII